HDRCWMALALKMNRPFHAQEIVVERPDGRRVTVLAHAHPIRSDGGALLGAVNVLVDITERKRAEDTLREADRAKSEFLAPLSHELRNSLAPIRNALEALRLAGPISSQLQWTVDVIGRQTQQMTRVVDDLLDVARISRGRLELRRARIDVAA